MKKGYRLSSEQAYFQYAQANYANFAPMGFINKGLQKLDDVAGTVGKKKLLIS